MYLAAVRYFRLAHTQPSRLRTISGQPGERAISQWHGYAIDGILIRVLAGTSAGMLIFV